MSYFDTDKAQQGKFPEKSFFWGIMATIRKELTDKMLEEVHDRRL